MRDDVPILDPSKAELRAEAEELVAAWRAGGGTPSTVRCWCRRCRAWSTVSADEPQPRCQWCKNRVAAASPS